MKESEMEKGMHITISDDPYRTSQTHTLTREMRNMAGKQYRIDSITNTKYGKAAMINSFYWHYHDLAEISVPEKKAHIFHFDVERLEI